MKLLQKDGNAADGNDDTALGNTINDGKAADVNMLNDDKAAADDIKINDDTADGKINDDAAGDNAK